MHADQFEISIIVPFFNEEENVIPVLREIQKVNPKAEIIAVDDRSQDHTWDKLIEFSGITALRFAKNRGQSAVIFAGLLQATKNICAPAGSQP